MAWGMASASKQDQQPTAHSRQEAGATKVDGIKIDQDEQALFDRRIHPTDHTDDASCNLLFRILVLL